MSFFHHASRNSNSNYWSGIAGTLTIQLAVLFAVSVAAIAYLNWSSNAALAEFMATARPAASQPSQLPQSSVPLQHVKSQTACAKKA